MRALGLNLQIVRRGNAKGAPFLSLDISGSVSVKGARQNATIDFLVTQLEVPTAELDLAQSVGISGANASNNIEISVT